MLEPENLRPLESVIVKMRSQGLGPTEIAERIKKKPETVERFIAMIEHKSDLPEQKQTPPADKRPVERVVEKLRTEGESYQEIGDRLNKGADHVERIESYAEIKQEL